MPPSPNGIGGVLATVHEISEKVVADRRVAILRDLGTGNSRQYRGRSLSRRGAGACARHGTDVPFALLSVVDADGKNARLAGAAGAELGAEARSEGCFTCSASTPIGAGRSRPLSADTASSRSTDLSSRFDAVPAGPWPEPPHAAVVLPLRSNKS